jgi:hypothetical protein
MFHPAGHALTRVSQGELGKQLWPWRGTALDLQIDSGTGPTYRCDLSLHASYFRVGMTIGLHLGAQVRMHLGELKVSEYPAGGQAT